MGVKLSNAQKIWTNVGNGRMAKNGLMIRKQNSLVLINYQPLFNSDWNYFMFSSFFSWVGKLISLFSSLK